MTQTLNNMSVLLLGVNCGANRATGAALIHL